MKRLPTRVTLAAIGTFALASAGCSVGVSPDTAQPDTAARATSGGPTTIVPAPGGDPGAPAAQTGPAGAPVPAATVGSGGVQGPATVQGASSAGPAAPEEGTSESGGSCESNQTITANGSKVELQGHCGKITIQATAVRVFLESADEVVINGNGCVVEAKKLGKVTVSQSANRVLVSESIGDVTVVGSSNIVKAASITGTVKDNGAANRISS